MLLEVRAEARATALTAAAAESDTELVVDSAGDFDTDGGTLELNGVQLEYVSIAWGTTEEDSDTITLAEPLDVAADVDDLVVQVIGGVAAEDWYAIVDVGGGDPAHVPLSFPQRQTWAPGTYSPSVPVIVSEDLEHIEDAPGRPSSAGARVAFWNTDSATVVGPGNVTFTLTHTPLPGSLHVRWGEGGLTLSNDHWALVGNVLTVLDPDSLLLADDVITTAYAYDPAAGGLDHPPLDPPVPPEITTIIPFTTSGWRYKQVLLGDTADYSSPSYNDSAWSTGATMFGDGNGAGAGAATNWDQNTSIWLRRTFPRSQEVTITVPVEDGCVVYVNGVLVGASGIAGLGSAHLSPPFVVTVDDALTNAGTNTLAIRANDESASQIGDVTSVDVEVTGGVLDE